MSSIQPILINFNGPSLLNISRKFYLGRTSGIKWRAGGGGEICPTSGKPFQKAHKQEQNWFFFIVDSESSGKIWNCHRAVLKFKIDFFLFCLLVYRQIHDQNFSKNVQKEKKKNLFKQKVPERNIQKSPKKILLHIILNNMKK